MAQYGVMVVEVSCMGSGAYLRRVTRLGGRTLMFRWVADARRKPLAFLGKSVSKGEGEGDARPTCGGGHRQRRKTEGVVVVEVNGWLVDISILTIRTHGHHSPIT